MAAVLQSARVANDAATFTINSETLFDVEEREALLDRAMGPGRTRKSSEKLRRNRMPAEGLALVARDEAGIMRGTVRLWQVSAGLGADGKPVPALLLGPLAVDRSTEGQGIGSALMREAIARAADREHGAILLVGDAPYYARFGFSAEKTAHLVMPGPFERNRFLALELVPGWLDGAAGMLVAAGEDIAA